MQLYLGCKKNNIMIKTLTVLAISLVVFNSSFGQQKPRKNSLGIGLEYYLGKNVTIPAIKVDYYLDDNYSINFYYKPGFNLSFSEINNDNSATDKYYEKKEQTKYSMSIGLGIERHFLPKSKFDLFLGLNAHYLFSGIETYSEERKQTYLSNNSNSIYYSEYEQKTQNPSSNGLKTSINAGISYFIIPQVLIGSSFNVGYYFSNKKGISKIYHKEISLIDNVEQYSVEKTKEDNINVFKEGLTYSVSIKASYFFNTKNL